MSDPINKEGFFSAYGLYIHVPFCMQKCLYCDFHSKPKRDGEVSLYLAALEREMQMRAREYQNTCFSTVFIGGGTPTCLSEDELTVLLLALRRYFAIESSAEFSMEANPGTVTAGKLALLREFGVNRLSLGLQTWQQELLTTLGRIHTSTQFVEAFQSARQAGFKNINVDLMFGLPAQSMKQWVETLQEVVVLHPEHISAYALQVEEGTPFFTRYRQGDLPLPADEETVEMYLFARRFLRDQGYTHYEISNFALPGHACRHNQGYWRLTPYLGLGPGAHSYSGKVRWGNETLSAYLAKLAAGQEPVAEVIPVDREEAKREFMWLGLRLLSGVGRSAYRERFASSLEEDFGPEIRQLVNKGLLLPADDGYRLTERALPVANDVFAAFV